MQTQDYNTNDLDKLALKLSDAIAAAIDKASAVAVNEFKDNFKESGFFGDIWDKSVEGTTMVKAGKLRDSIRVKYVTSDSAVIGSDLPYANIHNEGGTIRVTDKMKSFFWAKYKETGIAFWKNMALSKNNTITIPKRQFIGESTELERKLQAVIGNTITDNLNK